MFLFYSDNNDFGEFIELASSCPSGTKDLDGYHLLIIRGTKEHRGTKAAPTIEV